MIWIIIWGLIVCFYFSIAKAAKRGNEMAAKFQKEEQENESNSEGF